MRDEPRVSFDELEVAGDHALLWRGVPFTGVAEERDGSGRLVCESQYNEGCLHGLSREWDERGSLRAQDECWRGVRHGATRTWDANGQIRTESEYAYGIELMRVTWDDRGAVVATWVLPADHPARETLRALQAWARRQSD